VCDSTGSSLIVTWEQALRRRQLDAGMRDYGWRPKCICDQVANSPFRSKQLYWRRENHDRLGNQATRSFSTAGLAPVGIDCEAVQSSSSRRGQDFRSACRCCVDSSRIQQPARDSTQRRWAMAGGDVRSRCRRQYTTAPGRQIVGG